jgi:hypothetical protein
MADQFLGAASVAVAVLAYVVVVEALTAAAVLLAQFIMVRLGSMRALLGQPRPVAARELHEARGQDDDQPAPYHVGGGVMRWH